MKKERLKRVAVMGLVGLMGSTAAAQNQAVSDSSHLERMQEIVVSGVRAQDDAPFAVTEIEEEALQEHSKTGRELPMLLAKTPGIMAWGENGLGTGTTYMRIRGAGDSRINVTLDGVPLNSPEDQCVFWANMNSCSAAHRYSAAWALRPMATEPSAARLLSRWPSPR